MSLLISILNVAFIANFPSISAIDYVDPQEVYGTGYSGFYFGAGIGPGTPVGASGYVTNTRTIASTNIINEAASAITLFFRSGSSKSKPTE